MKKTNAAKTAKKFYGWYSLVEVAEGSHKGEVHRSEFMSNSEAEARNAKMSGQVIRWERASTDQIKKEHLYKTCQVRQNSSLEHLRGQFVSIVRFHEYCNCYSIKTIAGELQALVGANELDSFVL